MIFEMPIEIVNYSSKRRAAKGRRAAPPHAIGPIGLGESVFGGFSISNSRNLPARAVRQETRANAVQRGLLARRRQATG